MKAVALCLIAFLLAISCGRKQEQAPSLNQSEIQEKLIKANQSLVKEEALQIEEFIKRHQFDMMKTGTGLHYQVYKFGNGAVPQDNDIVTVFYSCFMIDGTLLYQADSSKPATFMLGKAQQPRGLEEALMLMPEGSRARVVIPSHLAYGLTGDDNKIQGATPLYYELTLLKINHEKK